MNHRLATFLSLFCASIFCIIMGLPTPSVAQSSEKPNVVLINVDDLGYNDTGTYGATKVHTPNIDKLAEQGKKFTDFHSASSVCSPSRYALITGRYPSRANFWSPIFLKQPLTVDTTRTTIADVMKNAGYATAIIGKWHLGFQTKKPINWNKSLEPGPLELGFDYYFGYPTVSSHPPFIYVENHHVVDYQKDDPFVYGKHAQTRWFPEKFGLEDIGGAQAAHARYDDRQVGTTFKNKAVSWIKDHKEEPFFLYFATTNIHHPFVPAPRFIKSSQAGRYGDYIEELDWMVGEILKTLDSEGLTDNTLVIFTSDNGGMLNQGGQRAWELGHHMNGKYLGFKFDAWEGGHRVPFIACWPGHIKPGSTSDQLLSNVDLLATMAALTNQKLKRDEGPDSYNMLPALTESPKKPIRDFLVISPSNKKNLTIRKGKWVYISGQGGGGFTNSERVNTFGGAAAFPFTGEKNSDIVDGHIKKDAPPAQLYNLQKDPGEHQDVYNKYPQVVHQLKNLLQKTIYPGSTGGQ